MNDIFAEGSQEHTGDFISIDASGKTGHRGCNMEAVTGKNVSHFPHI
jgi:hypothetical protein